MVDWDLVDKRRSKGWDWDQIAEDPKVGFRAEEAAGSPGRALRTLYYQRRSRGRRGGPEAKEAGGAEGKLRGAEGLSSPLLLIGYIVTPLLGVWFLLALVFPTPVGIYISAIPWIGLLLAAAAAVLAFGLLRSVERWGRAARTGVIVGLVLGLALSGGLAAYAVTQGCPTLTSTTTQEPLGWAKAENTPWTSNGAPVFFFYGSTACPYCSASSWSISQALMAFGSLSGTYPGHSDNNPQDIPNTPEVVLASASLQSPYVALHVLESNVPNTITEPATPSCIDQAYVSQYDVQNGQPGGIPFLVIGGVYYHVGTLVDPTQLRTTPGDPTSAPLSYSQVLGQINNQSGPAWNAISPQMYMLEALIVTLNHGQPNGVATNPNVANYLKQIH